MRRVMPLLILCILMGIMSVSAEQEQPLDHISVAVLPYLSYAPFYMAQEKGFFEEQGLDVEFVDALEDEAVFPALLRGDLDVYSNFLDAALFNAIIRDAGIQVVADKGYFAEGHCPSNAFVASKSALDAGLLNSADSLSGLHFSIETDTIEQYLLEKALAARDLDVDTDALTNDPLPPPSMQEALVSNAVQVGFASEPWVTRAVQTDKAAVWLSAEEIAPDLQVSLMVFGTRLLKDDPELGERFVTAYLQGVRQYREGATDENLATMHEFSGLDIEVIKSACLTEISADGVLHTDGIMDFQQWAFDRGLLDEIVPVEAFWNPRYVEAANAALGTPLKATDTP